MNVLNFNNSEKQLAIFCGMFVVYKHKIMKMNIFLFKIQTAYKGHNIFRKILIYFDDNWIDALIKILLQIYVCCFYTIF